MADCMPKRWASFIREGPMEDARNYGTRRRPPSKNKFAGPPWKRWQILSTHCSYELFWLQLWAEASLAEVQICIHGSVYNCDYVCLIDFHNHSFCLYTIWNSLCNWHIWRTASNFLFQVWSARGHVSQFCWSSRKDSFQCIDEAHGKVIFVPEWWLLAIHCVHRHGLWKGNSLDCKAKSGWFWINIMWSSSCCFVTAAWGKMSYVCVLWACSVDVKAMQSPNILHGAYSHRLGSWCR